MGLILFEGGEGEAVLTEQQVLEAKSQTLETQLRKFLTPFLAKIFENEGRVLVNSEHYPWLRTEEDNNQQLAPDFFVGAHCGVYAQIGSPNEGGNKKGTKNDIPKKSRKNDTPKNANENQQRVGTCHWDLRDSVYIGDCMLHLDETGVGENLTHAHHLQLACGHQSIRSFVFDSQECWLLESNHSSLVSPIVKVPWDGPGSLQRIREFFPWNGPWATVNQVCAQFNCVLQDPLKPNLGSSLVEFSSTRSSSFLGSGRCGRVFKVFMPESKAPHSSGSNGAPNQNLNALKIVLASEEEGEHGQLIGFEHEALKRHANTCQCSLLVRPTSELIECGDLHAYTMEPVGRSVQSCWAAEYIEPALRALVALHNHHIVHGDARLENLLLVVDDDDISRERVFTWIDLLQTRKSVNLGAQQDSSKCLSPPPPPPSLSLYRADLKTLLESMTRTSPLPEAFKALLLAYSPTHEESVLALINKLQQYLSCFE